MLSTAFEMDLHGTSVTTITGAGRFIDSSGKNAYCDATGQRPCVRVS